MSQSIELIQAYLADGANLNAVFKAAALTNDLDTNGVSFVSRKTVKLPKITFGSSVMGTITRGSSLTQMEANLDYEAYTLSQDKGNKIHVDKMDLEEGGVTIIQYANRYVRDIVVPEVDKYRLGVLSVGSSTSTTSAANVTAANSFDVLSDAEDTMMDNEVPFAGSVIYCKKSYYGYLKKSTDFTRFITTDTWTGAIKNQVKMFDEAKVQPIPAARWPYANVNFIVVNPLAVIAVVKHNESKFWESVPGYRSSQIDYDMYHDCFVISEKKKGVYVQWEKPDKPDLTAAATFATSQVVEMATKTVGAKIYYTDDGTTTPTASATEYTTAITLTGTKTIKAVAILDTVSSDVTTVTYTKS